MTLETNPDAAAPEVEAEAETCEQANCDAPVQTDAAGNPVVAEAPEAEAEAE